MKVNQYKIFASENEVANYLAETANAHQTNEEK